MAAGEIALPDIHQNLAGHDQFLLEITVLFRLTHFLACHQIFSPTRRAPRTPCASALTMSLTDFTIAAVGLPLPSRLARIASTRADPTTTPSAPSAIARACSPVRTPKPTQTGSLVWRLIRD